MSEKARSEFLVAPVLLACRDLVSGALSVYSGQRLDVDQAQGLTGECDLHPGAYPARAAPPRSLVTILEAKRGDIEQGLGQCIAQMVGTRLFNERAGAAPGPVFGAVTTGEAWQFLRLSGRSSRCTRPGSSSMAWAASWPL